MPSSRRKTIQVAPKGSKKEYKHPVTSIMDPHISSEDLPPAHSLSPVQDEIPVIEEVISEPVEEEPVALEIVIPQSPEEKEAHRAKIRDERIREEILSEKRITNESVNAKRVANADSRRRAQAKINYQNLNQRPSLNDSTSAAGVRRTIRQ